MKCTQQPDFNFGKDSMDFEPKNNNALSLDNAVSIIHPSGTVALTQAHNYIAAATSNNTRKAYQADIRQFIQSGATLPASYDDILRYLQYYASTLNPRTLERRLTAIKSWHLYQGFADPTAHSAIRKTLSGIKNIHGKPKDKAPPLTLEALNSMVNYLKSSSRLIDCRNNALLQIGFFGAFRRSELVGLRWEHIHFVPEGVEILIARSKTDQNGEGKICAIPYGNSDLCPTTALLSWRDRAQKNTGDIFCGVNNNTIRSTAITARQVNLTIKSIAAACHLPDADTYSSHSLRRGFASEASRKGAPFGTIMRQGRWRHEGTVLGYIDEGKRFDQNAVSFVLTTLPVSS
jgi:integrase